MYGQLAMLRPDGKGYWHFPDGSKPIPLMYSMKASRDQKPNELDYSEKTSQTGWFF